MAIVNLEPLCARYGLAMIREDGKIKEQEIILNKALGVLCENGIYAMSLYLLTCQDKDYGKWILTECLRELWQKEGIELMGNEVPGDKIAVLQAVRGMTENLITVILAKRLTEQTLTFARYHAKAKANAERPVEAGQQETP